MSCATPVLRHSLAATLASLALAGSLAGAAQPPGRYVGFCATAATGAVPDDCVHVLEMGAADARRILILVAGHSEGAGVFRQVGRYLAESVPDAQVWAFERREQSLVDVSRFGHAGERNYYLQGGYRTVTGRVAAATRDWGLAMELAELRRVVLAARAGGRRVFLGGHSSGAGTALAYAAWDFDGVAGYRDLAGLVLIDGGTHGSFDGEGYKYPSLESVREVDQRLSKIKTSPSPFSGDLGYLWRVPGAPESVPILYQLAADYALRDPSGPSTLQRRLPRQMQPPFRVTNAALLGWLLQTHAPAPDLQLHSGHIAPAGPLHAWISDGPANIEEVASTFAQSHPGAEEWYWPRRLSLDLEAVDPMVDSPITRHLGLHLAHARQIDVPLYVFQTGLTHGTVVAAAKWVVANSRIKDHVYVTDDSMEHLDPMLDAPGHNRFLTTVAEFLRKR